jgi:hypothetical protein
VSSVDSKLSASWRGASASLRVGLPVAGIALLALALQCSIHDRSAVPMDEGHLASAASRILGGELLYRDIHTGIFPGVYHLTALLFSLFGSDLLVTRWVQVCLNAAIAVCLWLVASRVVRSLWALVPPALYLFLVVVSFPVLTMLNYSALSLVFALFALLFLLRYLERARAADGVALGLLVAATAVTKQNLGVLVFIALLIGVLWGWRTSGLARRSLVSGLAPIAAAIGAVALAAVGYFVVTGTLGDLLDATLFSLGGSQFRFFSNPIPPLVGPHPVDDPRFTFLYTPPVLFNYLMRGETLLGQPMSPLFRGLSIRLSYGLPIAVLVATPVVLLLTGRESTPAVRNQARVIVVFAWLYSLGIFPSAIWSHLAFVAAPVLLVSALLGDRVESALRRRGRVAARIWVALAAAIVAGGVVAAARMSGDIRRWYPVPIGLPRASLFVSADQAELFRHANAFIESCAGKEDPIFVAPDIPLLYFISDRRNPTPYDLTIPGNVDGPLIVERLEASRTRCVVFNPRMYPEFPPFGDLFPDLSRYLGRAYRRTEIIRGKGTEWHGLVRRGAPER